MTSPTDNSQQGWQDIATAPKPSDWLRNPGRFLIGCWNPQIDEDGEPYGEGEWAWIHVASLSPNGWLVGTGGFAGVHGYASFPLSGNATHWQPLPPAPGEGE